jgi:MFS family permease
VRSLAEAGPRGFAFWLLVLAATLGNIVNGASTPVLARIVQEQLAGDAALAGFVVSLAGFASIAAMPIAGILADRIGVRTVLVISSVVAAMGLAVVLSSLTVGGLLWSRILFGGGNAAVATALTAWVVAVVPAGHRGRALSLFGLSVWVGLALGPPLGENLYQSAGYQAVWAVAIAVQLGALLLASFVRGAPRTVVTTRAEDARGLASWGPTLRTIALPGVVALTAWAAEGFMIAFLIQHLENNGLPTEGLTGAANVFTVFAASVIVSRLVIGGLPDRIGGVATARISLLMLGTGLAVLAVSGDFAVAAVGAVLIGAGYSPLYPALTMLATDGLAASRRSSGVGLFSAMTSIGYAIGSLLGGVLVESVGETASFLMLAGAQVLVVLLLSGQRGAAPASGASPAPEPS